MTPHRLTDDSPATSTWCYVTGITYYTTQELLRSFIDRISKGGNMLLNIAPMTDGTIPSQQQSILLGFTRDRADTVLYATALGRQGHTMTVTTPRREIS